MYLILCMRFNSIFGRKYANTLEEARAIIREWPASWPSPDDCSYSVYKLVEEL